MVRIVSVPSVEDDLNQDSKAKDFKEPVNCPDPITEDLPFADSFIDFDSLNDWFDDYVNPESISLEETQFGILGSRMEMANEESCEKTLVETQISLDSKPNVSGSEPIVDGSVPVGDESSCVVKMKVEDEDCKPEGSLGCFIEEEMRNVSLEGESGSSLVVDESCVKNKRLSDEGEDGSSNSEESESESSSSSSSSTSGSDDEDEEEQEQEKEEVKAEVKREADDTGELEEGEIRDVKEEDMAGGTSDDDDTEEEDEKQIHFGGLEVEFDDEDYEDDGGGAMRAPIRSKNELQSLPPVPSVDVTLQPHHQMLPVGVVLSIVDAKVIVEGSEKHNPLNEGSILWITEKRLPLGLVDEIFGPVQNPYYVVRYNSESEVPAGINEGTLISFVTEFANHVLNDKNLHKKGYDASGENDEEVSDDAEFSDDEKEAEYKRMLKNPKRGMNDQRPGNRRNNKKKGTNRDGAWKNERHSAVQGPNVVAKLPPNQNQHNISPVAAPLDNHNSSASSVAGQSFVSNTNFVPPFSMMQPSPLIMPSNGVWANGMTIQPSQNAIFPKGFPAEGMPWLSPNQQQLPYPMPMPNLVPVPNQMPMSTPMLFQQPQFFNPSQSSLQNMALPGGQLNFFTGSSCSPWQGIAGQNGFNQAIFGMGLQGQESLSTAEQFVPGSGLNVENFNFQQPKVVSHNFETPENFNMGTSSGRGRKPYPRGGGRFAGGRGRGRPQHK